MLDGEIQCNSVDDLVPGSSVERSGLTRFVDEACTDLVVHGRYYKQPPMYSADSIFSDVKQILARPFNALSGPLLGPSGVNVGVIGGYTVPAGLNGYPNISRLVGVYGIRFTLILRLEVASTPFIGGQVKLSWYNQLYDMVYPPLVRTITDVSQLPGVVMDISEQTMCVLRVPWVNSRDFMPLDISGMPGIQTFSTGLGFLHQLQGCSVGSGVAYPIYRLFVSLEDVELIGATAQTWVSQDNEKEGSGPIEAALNRTTRVATRLSMIPEVSSYTIPVAWATRLAAMLASAFGWSKPINSNPVNFMATTHNTFQQNCDGPDTAYNLGATHDNHVAVSPGFAGSDVDEMSIKFLTSKTAFIMSVTLSTSDTSGLLKVSAQMCPMAMYCTTQNTSLLPVAFPGTTASAARSVTPLMYCANTFALWRGSFKVTLWCNKTKFHSGRLLVQFSPFSGSTPIRPNAPLTDPQYPLSAVWDLRGDNIFTFYVPWISNIQYRYTNSPCGTLNIWVLDPLVAPTAVSQTINFMLGVAGGPDFEFAEPTDYIYSIAATSFPLSYVSQDGDMIKRLSTCIGEGIVSIKQLITRADGWSAPPGTTFPLYINAWHIPAWFASTYTGRSHSIAAYYASAYLYCRGSTVLDFMQAPASCGLQVSLFDSGSIYGNPVNNNASVYEPSGSLHLRIPYYGLNGRNLVGKQDQSSPVVLVEIIPPPSGTNYAPPYILTRAADDAQLGYFYVCPPLFAYAYSPVPPPTAATPAVMPAEVTPEVVTTPAPQVVEGDTTPTPTVETGDTPSAVNAGPGAFVAMPIPSPPPTSARLLSRSASINMRSNPSILA